MLNVESCEKISLFCAAAVGLVAAGSGAAMGLAAGATMLSLPAIWKSLKEKDNTNYQKTLKKISKKLQKDFPKLIEGKIYTKKELDIAQTALNDILAIIELDPKKIMAAGRDAQNLTDLMLDAAAKISVDYSLEEETGNIKQVKINRDILEKAIKNSLEQLDGNKLFEEELLPFFQKEVFSRFDELKDGQEEILKKQDALTKQIMAKLNELGEAQEAKKAGVSDEEIIKLAQTIAKDVNDPEGAFVELERAVEIAIKVQQDGRAGSNLDKFVSDVLARVAELSGAGEHDEAAEETDKAFAQWQERQEREKLAGITLLKSGLKQDLLRRDKKSAALRLMMQAKIEYPEQAERFKQVRKVQDEWYKRGLKFALMLDLQVSAELAKLIYNDTISTDQKGIALNDRANALLRLGERAGGEQGQEYLLQAVKAYDKALEIRTRKDMPAQWAMTQMNRATALLRLGERAGGKEGQKYLLQAVKAYDEALEIRTRKDMPTQWATTQMNRATALLSLGERAGGEQGQKYLLQAVKAYDEALEIRTRKDMPTQWATTQMNRAVALLSLGERSGGEQGQEYLLQAVKAYDKALEINTRKDMPADWAMTQMNRANALLRLGERAGGEQGQEYLLQAVKAYDKALEICTRKDMPAQWALTQVNRAVALRILGERAGGKEGQEYLQQAVKAYDEALEIFKQPSMEHYAEVATQNHQIAIAELEKITGNND